MFVQSLFRRHARMIKLTRELVNKVKVIHSKSNICKVFKYGINEAQGKGLPKIFSGEKYKHS